MATRIRKSIDKCFDVMYKDFKEGRDIDAIIMGYGFTFVDEFKEAKEYFLYKIKELESLPKKHTITIRLENRYIEDGTTFSAEGIATFLISVNDWLSQLTAISIQDGFEKKKPINSIELNIDFKANGELISEEKVTELMNLYPDIIGFSEEALYEIIEKRIKKYRSRK